MAADAPPAVQAPVSEKLTLARVFGNPDLNGPAPRALKLSPDGKLVTLLRNRSDEKERYDLWAMDTSSGQWRMLVDSKKVGTGAALFGWAGLIGAALLAGWGVANAVARQQ